MNQDTRTNKMVLTVKHSEKFCSGGSICDEKTVEYLRDLIAEKQSILTLGAAPSTGEETLNTDSGNSHAKNNEKSIVVKLLDQGKLIIMLINTWTKFINWFLFKTETNEPWWEAPKAKEKHPPSGLFMILRNYTWQTC